MRFAITLGDPNGIGPEVAIKAALHFANHTHIKPLLVGDGFVIEDTANRLGLDATPPFVDAEALDPAGYAPGTLDPRAGKATVGYAKPRCASSARARPTRSSAARTRRQP